MTGEIPVVGQSTATNEITVTVTDPNNTALVITSVKQYLGNTLITSASTTQGTETQKIITLQRSENEVYGLEIRFLYNNIEYGEMLTIK